MILAKGPELSKQEIKKVSLAKRLACSCVWPPSGSTSDVVLQKTILLVLLVLRGASLFGKADNKQNTLLNITGRFPPPRFITPIQRFFQLFVCLVCFSFASSQQQQCNNCKTLALQRSTHALVWPVIQNSFAAAAAAKQLSISDANAATRRAIRFAHL